MFAKGNALHLKRDYDGAIAQFDKAIALSPKSAPLYFARGGVWSSKGDYDRAIADYDEALRLDPKLPLAEDSRQLAIAMRGTKQSDQFQHEAR